MKLDSILEGTSFKVISGNISMEVEGLETDSRKIKKGDVFVALTGLGRDGHEFIEAAVKNGAVAVIAERQCESFGAALILCESTRVLLAYAAANLNGQSHKRLKIIGVTGTNGKTTVTHIIKQILELKGEKTGLIGTNHYLIGNEELASGGTTPEALELHSIFTKMAEAGCKYAVMEVSSHALALSRCEGLKFEVGVFTNLTEDHLNYHKDMADYADAKAKLFSMSRYSVINEDDPYAKVMKKAAAGKTVTYGIKKHADMKAEEILYSQRGIGFTWRYGSSEVPMKMAIPGEFSVYNALAGIGATAMLGLSDMDIAKGLLIVRGVKGRAEIVLTDTDYTVMIDYAHTPDGLLNILKTVKGFAEKRVIAVFGCGGDRDAKKRPIMGKIAAEYSDFAVVTSDNPRTEKPEAIVDEIVSGMVGAENKFKVIVDRTEAIAYALGIAQKGDVVVLAGKGHETYQDIGGQKIHYDEREVIKNILEN